MQCRRELWRRVRACMVHQRAGPRAFCLSSSAIRFTPLTQRDTVHAKEMRSPTESMREPVDRRAQSNSQGSSSALSSLFSARLKPVAAASNEPTRESQRGEEQRRDHASAQDDVTGVPYEPMDVLGDDLGGEDELIDAFEAQCDGTNTAAVKRENDEDEVLRRLSGAGLDGSDDFLDRDLLDIDGRRWLTAAQCEAATLERTNRFEGSTVDEELKAVGDPLMCK